MPARTKPTIRQSMSNKILRHLVTKFRIHVAPDKINKNYYNDKFFLATPTHTHLHHDTVQTTSIAGIRIQFNRRKHCSIIVNGGIRFSTTANTIQTAMTQFTRSHTTVFNANNLIGPINYFGIFRYDYSCSIGQQSKYAMANNVRGHMGVKR